MNIANDHLKGFIGTSRYHMYLFSNCLTDGVRQLAEQFHCYWFLDIICSYTYDLKNHQFQVWTLIKAVDSSAIIECSDGNDKILMRQKIALTDFPADKAVVWKEDGVLLLPSEH